jgi:hypothetical protein
VKTNTHPFLTLTALWAFVEAGLGGFLHALHLPFTGIVLGGFSVLIISLMAQLFDKPFSKILQATLIVLAIKALANPATSPFAYIAVGFQGLLGAIIYANGKTQLWKHLIFAVGSMLESAAQKLLIMTLFLGNTFWEGINGLGKSVEKIFHVQSQFAYTNVLTIGYLGIFAIWGIVLALWMHKLPGQLALRANNFKQIQPITETDKKQNSSRKNIWRNLAAVLLLVSILSFFVTANNGVTTGLFYVIRTLSILAIWQLVMVQWWRKKIFAWSTSKFKNNQQFIETNALIPTISSYVVPLYQYVSTNFKGLKKWKEFFLGLVIVSQDIAEKKQ